MKTWQIWLRRKESFWKNAFHLRTKEACVPRKLSDFSLGSVHRDVYHIFSLFPVYFFPYTFFTFTFTFSLFVLPGVSKHYGAKEKRRQICGGVFFRKLEQLERKSLVGKLQCFDKNGRNLTLETHKTSKIIWCYNFSHRKYGDLLHLVLGSDFKKFWCSSHILHEPS